MQKTKLMIVLLSLMLTLLLFGCSPKVAEQAQATASVITELERPQSQEIMVEFEDPGFEQIIRDAMDKPIGDIYESDLEQIKRLGIWNGSVLLDDAKEGAPSSALKNRDKLISLKDIQHLKNLEVLEIRSDSFTNYEYIVSLHSLKELSLGNSNNDIAWINQLSSLETLSLSGMSIEVLPPLNGLQNLKTLILPSSVISTSTGALELPNLEYLDLDSAEIEDLDFIKNLENLKFLNISWCTMLTDISGISGLTNLEILYMDRVRINKLNPLQGLSNLKEIEAESTHFENIDGLCGMDSLVHLVLGINNGTDLSALSTLTNLEELSIETSDKRKCNSIFPYIAELENIELINIVCDGYVDDTASNVADLSVLSPLESLQSLRILNGNITDISALTSLTNLESLNLVDNNVTDISVVLELPKLEYLNIAFNPIEDYSVLDQLDSLRVTK